MEFEGQILLIIGYLLKAFKVIKEFNFKVTKSEDELTIGDIIKQWDQINENSRIRFIQKIYKPTDEQFLNNEELKKYLEAVRTEIDEKVREIRALFEMEASKKKQEKFMKNIKEANLFTFSQNKNQLIEFYNAIELIKTLLKQFLDKLDENEMPSAEK